MPGTESGRTCFGGRSRCVHSQREGEWSLHQRRKRKFHQAKAASDSNQSADAVFHDFDSDGDLDAFVVTYGGPNKLYANNGGGSFIISDVSTRSLHGTAGALGDFNGDGMQDVFVANESERNIVYLGTGGGVFAERIASSDTKKSWGVAAGDLDGDGDTDLIVANHYQDKSRIYINDGDLDAFVVNSYSSTDVQYQKNQILLYNSVEGTFSSTDASNKTLLGSDVELADLDGENDLDAVVANYGDVNTIYINSGSATFSASTAPGPQTNSSNVGIADFTAP